MDLSVRLGKLRLENPTMLASGIWGVSKGSIRRIFGAGAGSAVIKSISQEPREGHHNPSIIQEGSYLINAIGYANMGMVDAKKEFSDLKDLGRPVIASVIGKTPEGFAQAAIGLTEGGDFSAIELPLSCPHTPGYGTMAGQSSPDNTYKITAAVKDATSLPVYIKLSPNTPKMGDAAKAAEEAGADAITMGNSLGPGMRISLEARKPIMGFGIGGVTGPAIFPIMVRCVSDVASSVNIPVIGCGGVTEGRDALEMMMAGATAVQIGSAVQFRGIEVFAKVVGEMEGWMRQNGYESIKKIIGAVHG